MDIQPIFRCAVGMDVHLTTISVSVILAEPGGEPAVHRRPFGAFQRERRAMADWMAGFKPGTGVMESTGMDWKSPYAALETVGIGALGVNAQYVNKAPGRKTDLSDAEWLAMLARAGVLRGSFSPPAAWRHRRQLSRYPHRTTARLAAEQNRLVRVLSDAGIRLTAVVADPQRVAARTMIDCLLNGGTPEQAVGPRRALARPTGRVTGRPARGPQRTHRFIARMIRPHLQFLETPVAALECQWFDALEPYAAAVHLLLTIPGIDRLAAAKRVVAMGVKMAACVAAGRLAKWAGVCPGNRDSAGKRRTGRTIPGHRYGRAFLWEIAWAAVRTTSQCKSR